MINKRFYKNSSDLDAIYKFLSKTYAERKKVDNWDVARWDFNRYCVHSEEELTGNLKWVENIQIWEDSSGILGVSHPEEKHDYFLQIDKNHEYLLEEMLLETLNHCKETLGPDQDVNISTLLEDHTRIALFEKYEGMKNDFEDDNRILLLDDIRIDTFDLEDYSICHFELESKAFCNEIADVYQRIWPTSSYISNPETVMNFLNAPGFRKDLSFSLYDSKKQCVGFYILWVDSNERHAHLYPFAIDRPVVKTDLIHDFLATGIRKLKGMGYQTMTLGGWYNEEDESIFKAIGFKKTSPSISYGFKL